jgi:hypothetical protein
MGPSEENAVMDVFPLWWSTGTENHHTRKSSSNSSRRNLLSSLLRTLILSRMDQFCPFSRGVLRPESCQCYIYVMEGYGHQSSHQCSPQLATEPLTSDHPGIVISSRGNFSTWTYWFMSWKTYFSWKWHVIANLRCWNLMCECDTLQGSREFLGSETGWSRCEVFSQKCTKCLPPIYFQIFIVDSILSYPTPSDSGYLSPFRFLDPFTIHIILELGISSVISCFPACFFLPGRVRNSDEW